MKLLLKREKKQTTTGLGIKALYQDQAQENQVKGKPKHHGLIEGTFLSTPYLANEIA